MGGEVVFGCQVDVVLEIIDEWFLGDPVFCFLCERSLNVFKPMAHGPEVERDVLPKIADNNLELREAIEAAVADDTEEMEGDTAGGAEEGRLGTDAL
jgi:hypothetical protein